MNGRTLGMQAVQGTFNDYASGSTCKTLGLLEFPREIRRMQFFTPLYKRYGNPNS